MKIETLLHYTAIFFIKIVTSFVCVQQMYVEVNEMKNSTITFGKYMYSIEVHIFNHG